MPRAVHATAALMALLAAPAAQAAPVTYRIEPTHTAVTFEALHFGTSTSRGRWNKIDGTVTLDVAAHTGSASITIDPAAVDTGVPALDEQLRGKNFFDVAAHPNAYFTSQTFTFDGDTLRSITGELHFRGKSNIVTLTAERFNCYTNPLLKQQVCGGDFTTTLKRSDWGMTFGVPFVADAVRLLVQVEATRE